MKEIYSSHIFMFPFRFDYYNGNEVFEQKTIMKRLKKEWVARTIDISTVDGYNQYSYFNSYARDILYSNNRVEKTKAVSVSLTRVISNTEVILKIPGKKEPYKLILENVFLDMFFTGVGIMSIKVTNSEYKNFEDVLKINDNTRKVYPLFLVKGDNFYMPDRISINDVCEDFTEKKSDSLNVGKHIMGLLGESFIQHKEAVGKYTIEPLLEDRMYVFSWCGNDKLSNKLSDGDNYLTNDDWYKYIFVDPEIPSVADEKMRMKQVQDATYIRWKSNGTMYGLTDYSFVCLTNKDDFSITIIYAHMETLYRNIALIVLASKASIIKFSDVIVTENDFKNNSVERLYKEYLIFYSKLNLHEVSYQKQGRELYSFIKERMQIDYLAEKLDDKFTKLHNFTNLQSEKKTVKSMNNITMLGASLLLPALVVSWFGIDGMKGTLTALDILLIVLSSSVFGYAIAKILIVEGEKNAK